MNTDSIQPCCPDTAERREVVVIGNGPSAIVLSYILSGHVPIWNGCPVSNDYLNMKLEQYVKDSPLLDQDLEFLSDGLEGRSRNPVSLLIDNLMHPDADLGARLQSKIKWRQDPSAKVDHLCLGRGGVGGVWNQLTSKQLKTVSMADWMELPNYPMETFRRQRQASRCRAAMKNEASSSLSAEINPLRATYEEVRAYYIYYVKRHGLANHFRNGYEVTSITRCCVDAPFYDDQAEEIRTPEPLWAIRGYEEQTKKPFVIYSKYVVLATGLCQKVTRPLVIPDEQASQAITFTSLNEMENLIIKEKRLTNMSKPLLVVGCGLTAIDVLLLCQQYSIPVVHVFRRAVDDHELALNQLPANLYPEYERIRELIRQSSSSTSSSSSSWSYRCHPQSEIISISEDGKVQIRHLRHQQTIDYDISLVARLTGSDVSVPFLLSSTASSTSLTTKKNTGLNINPYTYECSDWENLYAIGPLAGDKLVRFLQGGALACAASLVKKHRQTSSTSNPTTNSSTTNRLLYTVASRVRVIV